MRKKLKFGIIGFGKMGKIRHQTLNQMEQCAVQIIHEFNDNIATPETLKRINSAEELIASNDIDAVVISVPNYLIKSYVIASLESGKHVFCEKPPGINLPEVLAMKEAMEKSGCKLMFGFNHRHHQSIIKAKDVVDSGQFGEILWMRGRYGKSVDDTFYQDTGSAIAQKVTAGTNSVMNAVQGAFDKIANFSGITSDPWYGIFESTPLSFLSIFLNVYPLVFFNFLKMYPSALITILYNRGDNNDPCIKPIVTLK